MSDTFDFLINVMCKPHYVTAFNPFLNGTINGDFDGKCKQGHGSCLKSQTDQSNKMCTTWLD